MLKITIPASEGFDNKTEEFIVVPETTLQLEHSLLSVSKWESKWCKPFLGHQEMSEKESLDYIRCMTVTPNVDPNVYSFIPYSEHKRINEYISSPMTATTFNKQNERPSREIITSEIIYYWMVSLNIPFECQKWHLNRLLTLIKVCSEKNAPSKKMSKKDAAKQRQALNASRRAKMHSRG